MSIAFIASSVHKDNLAKKLNEQRKDGAFCDVHLKVSGQTLPTHACILTACSPFFQNLIYGERPTLPFLIGDGVPQEIELVMPGIEETPADGEEGGGGGLEAITDLIDYIYTGKIELKEDSVDLVVQLAEVFMLDGLSSLIQTYMNESAKPAAVKRPPALPPVKRGRTRQLLMLQRRRQHRRVFTRKPAPPNARANNAPPSHAVFEPEIRVLRNRRTAAAILPVIDDLSDEGSNSAGENGEEQEGESDAGAGVKRKYNFHCKQCDFVSADVAEIRQHRQMHPGRTYHCLSCDFTTAQIAKLIQHQLSAGHSQLECSVCNFVAADADALKLHLEQHDPLRPYPCQQCDNSFRTRSLLSAHEATHSSTDATVEARPFACEVCGRGFKSKYSLQAHQQTHEHSLACGHCPFVAASKSGLRAHERSAHGVVTGGGAGGAAGDGFRCTHDGCDYESGTRTDLQVHILKHSDPQPYQCQTCGQKYAQKNSLTRHIKIHNLDEFLLRCEACEFTTTRSDKMRNHMNKLHPDYSETLVETADDPAVDVDYVD